MASDRAPSGSAEHRLASQPVIRSLLETIDTIIRQGKGELVEIQINAPGEMFLEFAGGVTERRANPKMTADWAWALCKAVSNVLGLGFSERNPVVWATLPGGHRFTAVMGQAVRAGVAVTVRIRRHVALALTDYAIDDATAAEIMGLVQGHQPFIVSGGTSSGKTTFLNTLLKALDAGERLVTVEDVGELIVEHIPNQVNLLVARGEKEGLDYGRILDVVTRLSPTVAIVGELSVDNVVAAVRIANTGHAAFAMSLHADDPLLALEALRMNWLLARPDDSQGGSLPIRVMARKVAAIIQLERGPEGQRRISHIARRRPVKGGGQPVLDVPWWTLIGEPAPDFL